MFTSVDENPMYSTQNLDHLGLVSGLVHDLGLVSLIDDKISCDPRSRISYGQVVLGMLLNGLGFTSRPMYLSPQFFANKPLDLLIGPGIEASDLGDYQLGKTLDALHAYGCSKLFKELSSAIFLQEGLQKHVGHYDTTSVNVHGKGYETGSDEAIHITFGYSKDKRPDLRQFMIGLMVEPSHGIPWMFRALDGNTSDKAHFQQIISVLQQEAKAATDPMLLIADSALFSEEGLKDIEHVHYLTRVPNTYKKAKDLLEAHPREDFMIDDSGYGWKEHRVKMFKREMRWLVVWSDQAFKRESNTLERTISKQENALSDALKKLRRKDFGCKEDANKTITTLIKKYRYLQLDTIAYTSKNKAAQRGRPKTDAVLNQVWRVQATYKRGVEEIALKTKQMGKFILATNCLDTEKMPPEAILPHYKQQFQPEKGFRFLKSPMCLADALFLKKPERIEALSMVMCLALMVYGLGERKLRQTLANIEETIPDQKGKPTAKPTLRWVFQCFEGITLLTINLPDQPPKRQVLNLSVVQKQIIAIFGVTTENIYLFDFSP